MKIDMEQNIGELILGEAIGEMNVDRTSTGHKTANNTLPVISIPSNMTLVDVIAVFSSGSFSSNAIIINGVCYNKGTGVTYVAYDVVLASQTSTTAKVTIFPIYKRK